MPQVDLYSRRFFWLLLPAFFLFGYSIYRAFSVPFTIDESATVMDFALRPVSDILTGYPVTANNHMLNSLLIKACDFVFGSSEFAHRLPNLFAHAVYLFFSLLIARRQSNLWLSLTCFLLLNFQTYLLDYFSLARGYGLSMGFLMAGIYFLLRYKDTFRPRFVVFTVVAGMLSVLSNFSALISFLALWLGLLLVYHAAQKEKGAKNFFRQFTVPALLSLGLLALIYEPIRKLKSGDQLYYGGHKSFWKDTVGTLIDTFLYHADYTSGWRTALYIFAGLIFAAGLAWSLRWLIRNRNLSKSDATLVFVMLAAAVLISVLQHHLVGILYLVGRTALHFEIFFFLLCALLLGEWFTRTKNKIPAIAAGTVAGLLLLVHAAFTLNTTHAYEWQFDASSREVLADVMADAKNTGVPVRVGATWQMVPAVNYTRKIHPYPSIDTIWPDTMKRAFDFYYVLPSEDRNNTDTMIEVKRYPVSGTILYRTRK